MTGTDGGRARDDDAIGKTEQAQQEKDAAIRPFDIRRVIGGLFVLYGIVVLVVGIVDGDAAKKKAAGIDINLWSGLGMLVLGLVFVAWMMLNPLPKVRPSDEPADSDEEGRPPAH